MGDFAKIERDDEVPGALSGLGRIRNKRYNKGLAYTRQERQLLGIHGLLPHIVKTMDAQIADCFQIIKSMSSTLDKHVFLRNLSQYNERLFFNLLRDHIEDLLPICTAPTIAEACLSYYITQALTPKGLYITIKDKGHIYYILKNWLETDIKIVCCTNGGRVLGLGDLGANGMPIVTSKIDLYTVLAGIKPHQLLPICLDVGTNNHHLLDNGNYVGVRENRCSYDLFEEFMDEFMLSVTKRFGVECIIQFEDFENESSFKILDRYREKFCAFNDGIQATGAVILAGLFTSIRLTNIQLKDHTILFMGAGGAALGTANTIVSAMVKDGMDIEEARKHIWLFDSGGLVCDYRIEITNQYKMPFRHSGKYLPTLLEVIQESKPTVLIGASAVPAAFTKEIIEEMCKFNEKPIIFVLSNPPHFAECSPNQAILWSKGKVIFASGSQYAPVEFNNQIYHISQCDNTYIYPGLVLGVMCAGIRCVTNELYLVAARKLAKLVKMEYLERGLLYPPIKHSQIISLGIAESVMHYAYRNGLATNFPKPKDKITYIKSKQYNFDYPATFPKVYKC